MWYNNKQMKTIPKTIKFTPELFSKVTKLAAKKDWSFHKTVLNLLKGQLK